MSTNPDFVPHPRAVADHHRASGRWNDDTVADWVASWAQMMPGKVAIEDFDGRRCSYGELEEKSLRFANALLALGLQAGDVVAVQLPSSIEFLIVYLGVNRMGGILATMHMPYREGELEPLIRCAQAKAIVCGPAIANYEGPTMMQRLRAIIQGVRYIIVVRGTADSTACLSFNELIDRADAEPIKRPPAAADPALLCFTSGTSAGPKAVMRSYETFTANARSYVKEIAQGASDRVLIAPPFTHVFGLLCANNTIYTGGTVLPLTHFDPKNYIDMIERLRPTIVYSVPTHLAAALKADVVSGRDLSSVRTVILGGSICPPHVAAKFERHLPKGRVGSLFGMTEVLLVTQTPMDAPPAVRHGTVGRPIPGVEARIVSSSNIVLGDGEEGELQLSGFSILSAYLNNPEANAAAFTASGWFRTGDLAVWQDGNIVITGRVKDLINRGGIKINPSDIEAAIMEHPAVIQAAVVPMPDQVLGERICAFVTLVPGTSLELNELCRFLAEHRIAKMRWPEHLVAIDQMPMTPTRKIMKGVLREMIRQTSSADGTRRT